MSAPPRSGGARSEPAPRRDPQDAARGLLLRHGCPVVPDPDPVFGECDALATRLMDLFRRTASKEAFETLAELAHTSLLRRVRMRLRGLGGRLDAEEVLQDTLINIYRYPDRFDARKPAAFRVWSASIVDNAIRRRMRHGATHAAIALRSDELLAEEPDWRTREPCDQVADDEDVGRIASAFQIVLAVYLQAYESLSERERFVLQMVEVRGLRYAAVAKALHLRAEALKMVVFRARRRIFERISVFLPAPGVPARSELDGAGISRRPRRAGTEFVPARTV